MRERNHLRHFGIGGLVPARLVADTADAAALVSQQQQPQQQYGAGGAKPSAAAAAAAAKATAKGALVESKASSSGGGGADEPFVLRGQFVFQVEEVVDVTRSAEERAKAPAAVAAGRCEY